MKSAPRLVSMLILFGATALAAVPGRAKAAVAFSALQNGVWQAFVADRPGSPPREVTPASLGDALAPALSPHGERVALEVLGRGVYVCSTATGNPACTRVDALGAAAFRPAWRGEELAASVFTTTPVGEDADLVLTADGRTKRVPLVLQTGVQDHPALARDGRSLLYTTSLTVAVGKGGPRVAQNLWLADLISYGAHQFLPGDWQDNHPSWSPRGDRIAFASNRSGSFEIWLVRADGTQPVQLTRGPGPKTWPVWSPDERSVLYATVRDNRQRLWMVSDAGEDLGEFLPFGKTSRAELRDPEWR